MDIYINEIIKLSQKAAKQKEVPFGALVVYKNRIIAKAYNQRIKKKDVMAHAEILAIKKATSKIKDWRLNECDLYVTLEPCHMCMEVIRESRIKNVYYLTTKHEEKKKYNKTIVRMIDADKYKKEKTAYKIIISDFFKLNCNRK